MLAKCDVRSAKNVEETGPVRLLYGDEGESFI